MRYLGNQFTAHGDSEVSPLSLWVELRRIKRAPLKLHQKLNILRKYLIPRYVPAFQRPTITRKVLKEADGKIRAFVRAILHLPAHCSNHILYAPVPRGGLGLFEFRRRIPVIVADRIERLSSDPIMADIISIGRDWIQRVRGMIQANKATKTAYQEYHALKLENSYSGNGITQVTNHRTCTTFIYDPPIY